MIKDHGEETVKKVIEAYVVDCKNTGSYMKNFGTFLNNFPDPEEVLNTDSPPVEPTPPRNFSLDQVKGDTVAERQQCVPDSIAQKYEIDQKYKQCNYDDELKLFKNMGYDTEYCHKKARLHNVVWKSGIVLEVDDVK